MFKLISYLTPAVKFDVYFRRTGLVKLSTTAKSVTISSPIKTTTVIPRIRTIYPHPVLVPHPETGHLFKDNELWAKTLAQRSIVSDELRVYLETFDANRLWDVGVVHTTLSLDPNCSYRTLFEIAKSITFTALIDDLIHFYQRSVVIEEMFDYMAKFIDNPNLVHDTALDPKRDYLINVLGHAFNGLRDGGCSPMQIRRLAKDYSLFVQLHVDESRPALNWDNYWPIRFDNSVISSLTIPVEAVGGLDDLPQSLANDPDVHQATAAAWQLVIAANDLVSYLRERDTDEGSFNLVSFLMAQCGLDEQSAVDRVCEQIISYNRKSVSATKDALRSPVVRQHRQLDVYMKHIYPRCIYGLIQGFEMLNRNRLDGRSADYTRQWTCDDLFVNDSDPNNAGKSFEIHLKKYEYLNIMNQEYL